MMLRLPLRFTQKSTKNDKVRVQGYPSAYLGPKAQSTRTVNVIMLIILNKGSHLRKL